MFQGKAFSEKKKKKKSFFQTKKFYFDENVNIFEAFHLTLVMKNCQIREHRKRSGYSKKSSSDWQEKD